MCVYVLVGGGWLGSRSWPISSDRANASPATPIPASPTAAKVSPPNEAKTALRRPANRSVNPRIFPRSTGTVLSASSAVAAT